MLPGMCIAWMVIVPSGMRMVAGAVCLGPKHLPAVHPPSKGSDQREINRPDMIGLLRLQALTARSTNRHLHEHAAPNPTGSNETGNVA